MVKMIESWKNMKLWQRWGIVGFLLGSIPCFLLLSFQRGEYLDHIWSIAYGYTSPIYSLFFVFYFLTASFANYIGNNFSSWSPTLCSIDAKFIILSFFISGISYAVVGALLGNFYEAKLKGDKIKAGIFKATVIMLCLLYGIMLLWVGLTV